MIRQYYTALTAGPAPQLSWNRFIQHAVLGAWFKCSGISNDAIDDRGNYKKIIVLQVSLSKLYTSQFPMEDFKFPFVYLKTNKTRDSNQNQATTSTMTYTTSSLYSSFQVITTFTTIPMMPITWITTESKQRSLMDKFTPMERRRTPVRKRKDRREHM